MRASNETDGGATVEAQGSGETHSFQAEVSRLLHLMVHSVYSDRDVFLRELISNAADACDKLRYEALSRPELLADDPELSITLAIDKANGTLTVSDNGIGMSRDELVDNLGTIARSGTHAFMEKLGQGEGSPKLIGQFGVGFYAAFMVAARVDVTSRRAGSDEAWVWSSDGTGTFTVEPFAGEDAPKRGTSIRLTLKEDAKDFLEPWKIEQVVRAYSDHVAIPIRIATIEQKDEEPRQINNAAALWMRPKSEITEEQYKEFFGAIAGIYSDPALIIHYRAEGRHEYTVLLAVPSEQPFDLFDPERRGRQKLYVRRVYITDDAEFLPGYLRFVRGVIDSEDMPLNLSREMLQNNPLVAQIRKAVTKRVLSELKKTAEQNSETYGKIWSAFGAVIKEGLYEDMERRDELFEIARFRTTTSPEGETRSLKDYVGSLKTNQTAIYYVAADDATKAAAAPQIEGFKARGIEVLLLTDPVDNFWTRTALGFDGKPFRSVTQGAADLAGIPVEKSDEATESDAQDKPALGTLVAAMKQTLGDAVSDVRLSDRLTSSPVCLVADVQGMDRNMERLLAKQKPGAKHSQPILEINPTHPMVTGLAKRAKEHGVSDEISDAAWLLLDEAYVLEGEPVPDPAAFARRLSGVMARILG
ncbi:molecular chaperone HtpG [Rhodoligotrophos appendicifer]|uniref:molecular chaperone HtpG n=1 Tax=Rhodoligotrophos appendicifer TaxID=987056 RepID=UPI00118616D7|nr:molecular chaperone HtpG [Rhodoligotrophos appendicifer]